MGGLGPCGLGFESGYPKVTMPFILMGSEESKPPTQITCLQLADYWIAQEPFP